jgi:hypothetical protein
MACRIASEVSIVRIAATLMAAAGATLLAFGVVAQTLTDPNPPAKSPTPKLAAKAHPSAAAKSCSTYGAGFVNVPGTDTCVKIGGWVSVEGSAGH